MTKKMSKKKVDISFLDPKTMEVVCTFNGCVHKFTEEDFETHTLDSGKTFVSYYHKCNECGRKAKAKGDGKKAYIKWREIMSARDPETLSPDVLAKLQWGITFND
jgi:hypothetical protein